MRDLIKLVEGLNETESVVDRERLERVLLVVQHGHNVWYELPYDSPEVADAVLNVLSKSIESTDRHLWVVKAERLGDDLDVTQFKEPVVVVIDAPHGLDGAQSRAIVIAEHDINSRKLPVAIVLLSPNRMTPQVQARFHTA